MRLGASQRAHALRRPGSCYTCGRDASTPKTSATTDDIEALKHRLDALRSLGAAALAQLEHFYDVQLTYTSNAIEGNTLTYGETAIVIETGSRSAASRSSMTSEDGEPPTCQMSGNGPTSVV